MKIRKLKLSFNSIYAFFVAFTAFIYLRPYFVWESYRGGMFSDLRDFLPLVVYCFTIVRFMLRKNKYIEREKILFSFYFFCMYNMIIALSGGSGYTWGTILFLIFTCLFILTENKILRLTFKYFSIIFAISLIFPILTWIAINIGIDLPHSTVVPWENIKIENYTWYDEYFLCVFRREKWGRNMLYLNGVFDEQGVVGTYAGLILVADRMKLRNNLKNIIIFIGGILSFSLAFYMMIGIYYFLESKISFKKKILIIIGISSITTLLLIFFKNTLVVKEFLNRFINFDFFNRYDDSFENFYRLNMSLDRYSTWFGHGKDAFGTYNLTLSNLMNSSSYKILIYDYGYLGFINIITFFIFGSYLYQKNLDKIIFSVVFALSIYQRPYVLSFSYMVLFIAGNAMQKNKKNQRSNKYDRYYLDYSHL